MNKISWSCTLCISNFIDFDQILSSISKFFIPPEFYAHPVPLFLSLLKPTGCLIMIAYSWKNTSWQGRAKWKIPPCREFNSTSDGVFFIKNVAAVLVLRQKKRNQLQNSVLQEVGQRQSRIWVMYAYLNNFNELWAKISKVSTLWEQLLASKRSDLQFIC